MRVGIPASISSLQRHVLASHSFFPLLREQYIQINHNHLASPLMKIHSVTLWSRWLLFIESQVIFKYRSGKAWEGLSYMPPLC